MRLGTYELEEDAARAHDKVARILGRSLNFPKSDALDINGPRSKGADEAVKVAVEAAQKFVAAGGYNQKTSAYIGVRKDPQKSKQNPWTARIIVSSGIGSVRTYTCAHKYTHTHMLNAQVNYKRWNLGFYDLEADAAAARDMVARIFGLRLNFERPREITGQRSKGADRAVADAVKAANALMLGRHNLASSVLSTIHVTKA